MLINLFQTLHLFSGPVTCILDSLDVPLMNFLPSVLPRPIQAVLLVSPRRRERSLCQCPSARSSFSFPPPSCWAAAGASPPSLRCLLVTVEPLASQPLAEPSRVGAQSRTSLLLVSNCPFWSEVSSAIVAARERKYTEVCEE